MQSLNVLQAKKDLKDYQIVAPFDGSVDEIDFQLYQQISSTNYITLTNPSIYRIEVGLDQVDIVSIHI
jgi:multidrug resistance efflux pump